MKQIMRILDYFETPKYGVVISGHNNELDSLSNDDIKAYIGNTILIRKPNGEERIVDGISVDIGTSLVGRKNISIALPRSVRLSDIEAQSIVFVSPDSRAAT